MISLEDVQKARVRLNGVATKTPLVYNAFLSEKYECKVFLKREDLQVVRSYKIRGAYNKMARLSKEQSDKGIVCASAGNHAQGVALACMMLGIEGNIFMPLTTPKQKVGKVERFGGKRVKIHLIGDTFDDSYQEALQFEKETGANFIHPFNDPCTIAGQGTVGLEILDDLQGKADYLLLGIGGGGLASGVGSVFNILSPETRLIGVEPSGAAAMHQSLNKDKIITLPEIDPFVDGAAVKSVGENTFRICKEVLDKIVLVPEGRVCTTILTLYNEDAIVVEPAGALTVSALENVKEEIKGKTVVCVISGGNNDITRMEEIKERSLLEEGLKHYFVISFPQRAGALKEFVNDVLGERDDITFFQYVKKNSRESGPALVGIELKDRNDYAPLIERMEKAGISYSTRQDNQDVFDFLV